MKEQPAMADEEIQLRAQKSIQEYEDAVENLDPNFAELGQKCITVLDEFISYWNQRPELNEHHSDDGVTDSGMKEYAERQLEWARHEKNRVNAQLTK
jgi:hypothetical protein